MVSEKQAQKKAEEAPDKIVEAVEASGDSELNVRKAVAERDEAQAAVEEKLREKGDEEKYTEEGYVIGVDGKNPVSNVNPDPRCIR